MLAFSGFVFCIGGDEALLLHDSTTGPSPYFGLGLGLFLISHIISLRALCWFSPQQGICLDALLGIALDSTWQASRALILSHHLLLANLSFLVEHIRVYLQAPPPLLLVGVCLA